ncbi:MAG TPA: energy-coupling factor transporter transmembrane component T, partial [Bacillota bacterium]
MDGLFAYQAGHSLLHRLNPLTKLVTAACAAVAAFAWPDARLALALAGLLLLLAASAGVLGSVLRPALTALTPLAVALFGVHSLFYPGRETPLLILGPVTVWREGVAFAFLILCRVAVLMLSALTTMATTHPRHLSIALVEKGLSPKAAYVFMAALQFIPEMQQRSRAILEAQQARGLETAGSLWRRLKAFVALMGPLIIGALIATETRALGLEARGFSRTGPRTFLTDVPDTRWERTWRWCAV